MAETKRNLMGASVAALMAVGVFSGASAGEMRDGKDAGYANDFAILVPAAQLSGAISQFENSGAVLTEGLMDAQEFYSNSLSRVEGAVNKEAEKAIQYHISHNKQVGADQVKNGEWSLQGLEAVSDYVMEQHQVIKDARLGARSDMIGDGVDAKLAQSVSVDMMAYAIQPRKDQSTYKILSSSGLTGGSLEGLSDYQDTMNASISDLGLVGPGLQEAMLVGRSDVEVLSSDYAKKDRGYDIFDLNSGGSEASVDDNWVEPNKQEGRHDINSGDKQEAVDLTDEDQALDMTDKRQAVKLDRDSIKIDLTDKRQAIRFTDKQDVSSAKTETRMEIIARRAKETVAARGANEVKSKNRGTGEPEI